MTIRAFAYFTLALSIFVPPLHAAEDKVGIGAEDRTALEVTIYNDSLAQVYDQRRVEIGAGISRLLLEDVSGQIMPNTAKVSAGNMRILEMNFDYDLMTPQKLLEKAVGQQVRIYRAHPTQIDDVVETATVLSANGGAVLQFSDRIETYGAGGLPGRIVFDQVPENLRSKPTLSSVVEMARAYDGAMDLTYLTRGLSWETDYVAQYDDAEGKLDIVAWVTLRNNTGTDFRDTNLKLVAGSPKDVYARRQYAYEPTAMEEDVVVSAARSVQREQLAAYHMYSIPFRVDIMNAQTKQVELFERKDVRAKKRFWGGDWDWPETYIQKAEWGLSFDNDEDSGLGIPLPSGRVGVYQTDGSGKPQFVGSAHLGDTPIDQETDLSLGEAFDVTYEGQLTELNDLGEEKYHVVARVIFNNAGRDAIEMTYELTMGAGSVMEQESHASVSKGPGQFEWTFTVPARGETALELTYMIDD